MYLVELSISWTDADLPAIGHPLIHTRHTVVLGSKVQVHILLETLDRQALAIEVNLGAQRPYLVSVTWQ